MESQPWTTKRPFRHKLFKIQPRWFIGVFSRVVFVFLVVLLSKKSWVPRGSVAIILYILRSKARPTLIPRPNVVLLLQLALHHVSREEGGTGDGRRCSLFFPESQTTKDKTQRDGHSSASPLFLCVINGMVQGTEPEKVVSAFRYALVWL